MAMHQRMLYLNIVCKSYKGYILMVDGPKLTREPDVMLSAGHSQNRCGHIVQVFRVLVLGVVLVLAPCTLV